MQRMQAIEESPAGHADVQPGITRLERLLARGEHADKDAVRDAYLALTDAELTSSGLNAYRMNLLSLFGETWTRDRINAAARGAAISKLWLGWEYHHHYLPGLGKTPGEAQLKNVPVDLVKTQLGRGRGLVAATFHQGHFRYIPSDLAHAGVPLCIPLAADSFGNYKTARDANPDAALWHHLDFTNVEDRRGALTLARLIAKGGCVFAAIDGNTGIDGPRGEHRRGSIHVLGTEVRVKDGLVRMAARFGAPILPMFAHTIDGERICHTAPLIDPGEPLHGEDADAFVESATSEIYARFGENLLAHAGEWSGGDLFHQWRVPGAPASRAIEDVQRELSQRLAADGGRAVLNPRRMVELSRANDDDQVWTDAVTLRCYRFPEEMRALIDRLRGDGGVDIDWLDRHEAQTRSRFWRFLCELASRDAVLAHGGER